jgi:hypothetical protein
MWHSDIYQNDTPFSLLVDEILLALEKKLTFVFSVTAEILIFPQIKKEDE